MWVSPVTFGTSLAGALWFWSGVVAVAGFVLAGALGFLGLWLGRTEVDGAPSPLFRRRDDADGWR